MNDNEMTYLLMLAQDLRAKGEFAVPAPGTFHRDVAFSLAMLLHLAIVQDESGSQRAVVDEHSCTHSWSLFAHPERGEPGYTAWAVYGMSTREYLSALMSELYADDISWALSILPRDEQLALVERLERAVRDVLGLVGPECRADILSVLIGRDTTECESVADLLANRDEYRDPRRVW